MFKRYRKLKSESFSKYIWIQTAVRKTKGTGSNVKLRRNKLVMFTKCLLPLKHLETPSVYNISEVHHYGSSNICCNFVWQIFTEHI